MKLITAFAAVALLSGPVLAETCKNAKGQFAKCGTPGAMPSGMSVAAGGGKISAPDASGKCKVVVPEPGTKQKKGQFASCPKGGTPAIK